jgi:DNA-binding MarR family transcriptional regulator
MEIAKKIGKLGDQKGAAMTTQRAPTLAPSATGSTPLASSESILHHLGNTYYELATAFERHMGMSRARWGILSRLGREGSLTQTALAQLLHVDAAAITRQVKQLEAEGLVTRWAVPEDNRFTMVALTEQGRAFVNRQRAVRDEFERIATTGLSVDDLDHMRYCLQHMRRNLELLAQEG